MSQGLDAAQRDVLSPLRSVGTDLLVTRTVTGTTGSPSPTPSATGQPQQGGFFGGGGLQSLADLEDADATALLNDAWT